MVMRDIRVYNGFTGV